MQLPNPINQLRDALKPFVQAVNRAVDVLNVNFLAFCPIAMSMPSAIERAHKAKLIVGGPARSMITVSRSS